MRIKIVNDFAWLVVTDKAKEIFNSGLFELFVVTDDGGEYEILDHESLNKFLEEGRDIAIEGDYLALNDPRRFKSFEINTTAWNEENFVIATDLTESQIVDVITPLVMRERAYGEEYSNADLVDELEYVYQDNIIIEIEPKKIVI